MLYVINHPFNWGGEHFEPSPTPVDIKDPECWKYGHNNGMAVPYQGVALPVIPASSPDDKGPASHSPDAAEAKPFAATDLPDKVIALLVGAGVTTIEQAIDHDDLTGITDIGDVTAARILEACEAVL